MLIFLIPRKNKIFLQIILYRGKGKPGVPAQHRTILHFFFVNDIMREFEEWFQNNDV